LKTQNRPNYQQAHLTKKISHFISNHYGLVTATGFHGGKDAEASSESAR
jgi:hypothetical protein